MNSGRLSPLFGRDVRRVHCLGVGGMGVGPLAIYLAGLGYTVTGEDDALGAEMGAQLAAAGVALGPVPVGCDLVVHSSAVKSSHPAYVAAQARGLPLVRRGDLLAELATRRKLVAICGSHGKTTTTALLITALRAAHFPAGYVLGGLWADGTPPAAAGTNDWLVAEIDESDGTIGQFAPEITVAVNLDWDHPDHYRTPEELGRAFADLFARTRGTVLNCGAPSEFTGTVAAESPAGLELALTGKFAIPTARVRASGQFNAANALAALAAAQTMGVTLTPDSLAAFPGVRRRQTVLTTDGDVTVLEDYAHHPAEIRALLGSLRQRLTPEGRLWVVFQPHRHSRTAQFASEFAAALALADRVHLMEVYSAGEAMVKGGSSGEILRLISARPQVALHLEPARLPFDSAQGLREVALHPVYSQLVSASPGLEAFDATDLRAGDVLAFVGAGDIDRAAREWLAGRSAFAEAAAATGPRWSATFGRAEPGDWDRWAAELAAAASFETKIRREEPLARKTTLRVGGAARIYVEPADAADLRSTLLAAAAAHLPVYGLGRGSNLIVPDTGVDGVVVALAHPAWSRFEPRPDGSIWVGAGLRLKNLCGLAAAAGLAGFEFLEGIPGSVGGALRMNAGAMGGWMFDVVEEVELISWAGEQRRLPKAQMHIAYRHCAELHGALALGALLRAPARSESPAIGRQIDAYRQKRHESQPREPSAGCIFKNPAAGSAGRLIDLSGLKGERVGGAEVSPVHANFIVNRGEATSADVLELIRRVRARVRERQGVDLEPEVLLYGQDWKDVL
jgi:UDP-N-acetylenolpyruvoylglucosamine reductase